MQRTIRFPLLPTPQQRSILLQTLEQYTACFNRVAAFGWETGVKNGVELHRATYYPLRTAYPKLPSQLVISSRSKAAEAVKAAFTWKIRREKEYKKMVARAMAKGRIVSRFKPVRCPHSDLCSIRYDARSYSIRGTTVSLATIEGRQEMDLYFYPYALRLLEQSVGYDSADLVYCKGRFWLHLVVTLAEVEFLPNG